MPKKFPGLAAVAWIIQPGPLHVGPNIPCHGVTQVHGAPSSVNSYRAELQGLHALLLVINHVCSTYQLTTGKVLIGCDNQGVLHHVRCPPLYVPCVVKHADLVRAILNTQCSCPIQLEFQYVAGHQDEFTCFEDLPPLAQLNVQADHMAKQALHVLGNNNNPALLSALPGVTWHLLIQDRPILSEPCPDILNHLSAQSAIPY